MRRSAICAVLILVIPAVCFICSCGPRGPVLQEVTGTILLQNQPIEEGIINFEPLDGQSTRSGAMIVKGQYTIPKDKGLLPGRYKVSILAGDGFSGGGNAGLERVNAKGGGGTRGRDQVPPEYNENSKIIWEVKDSGPNKFDYSVPKRAS